MLKATTTTVSTTSTTTGTTITSTSTIGTTTTIPTTPCRANWTLINEKCFLFVYDEKSIMDAEVFCNQHKSIVYEPRDKLTDVLVQKYLVEWFDYWIGMIVQGSKK